MAQASLSAGSPPHLLAPTIHFQNNCWNRALAMNGLIERLHNINSLQERRPRRECSGFVRYQNVRREGAAPTGVKPLIFTDQPHLI